MNFDKIINDDGDCKNVDLSKHIIVDHAAPGVRNQLFNDMNVKSNAEIVRAIMNVCKCDENNGKSLRDYFVK